MEVIIILVGILIVLILLGWLGLRITPKSFPAFPHQTSQLETVPLTEGLPAPVERFYYQIYGQNVPVVESAVITGRAKMRIYGITLPARFRFTHSAGQDYRHYIETTFFGIPLMKVNEHYLDGESRLELPFGVIEDEPKVDQGANLALWAESVFWLPSILLTDSRVRWEPIDNETALLVVPFADEEERFVVRFTPETGLISFLEAMRYKNPADEARILWIDESRAWNAIAGNFVSTVATITWLDEGTPWAVFYVEEVVYNAAVQEYIRLKGP